MGEYLMEAKNLHVSVNDTEILHGVDFAVNRGEVHVLMGPNGTGKSTFGFALIGNPKYDVTEGSIIFDGKDITEEPVNDRAKMGMFLSFQNPIEVPGISLENFSDIKVYLNIDDLSHSDLISLLEFGNIIYGEDINNIELYGK